MTDISSFVKQPGYFSRASEIYRADSLGREETPERHRNQFPLRYNRPNAIKLFSPGGPDEFEIP